MTKIDPIYQEIASKITKEENKALPRVVKMIANLRQAKIMRELPLTAEAITEKLELKKATVDKDLQYLYERGLILRGRKGWNLVNNLVLVKDRCGSANHKYDDDEFFDLLREMSLENAVNLEERLKNGGKITVREGMRVVPKWRTIKDIPGILPIEDLREIFKANSPIVVHNCPCRVVYRARPCKDTVPIDICLATGATAKRFLERKAGKELTYDELIAFLDKVDEWPVVSMTGNSNLMPTILCSCCNDCCGLFVRAARTKPVLGKVTWAKSRFVVEDNPENCTACGICADTRCPVGAITIKDFPKLEGKRSYTNVEECIGCGLCVLTCPNEARKMKLVRPPEHIPSPASIFDNEP
jgi:formate hydrogenlyase subunit 6/NADH:ubiquinone oxidoreductase subunit I/DNA-binding transcriptional ArsR family regulator